MQMGVKFYKDRYTFLSEWLFKWNPSATSTMSALYGGLRYNRDGTSLLIGFKVGSMKLLFPIVIVCPTIPTERTKDFDYSESDHLEILCIGLFVKTISAWFSSRKNASLTAEWNTIELDKLKRRQRMQERRIFQKSQ
jgi:hypothetical protein